MDETGLDLKAEIRDLAARRDITDAVHRYMRGLDRLDRDCLLSAFHPDAYVDCGLLAGSPTEFADFALGFLADMDATHHQLGQVRIEFAGGDAASGKASGESYFRAFHDVRSEAGEVRDLFIAGRYIDEFTRGNGEWRIARRRLVTDWVSDNPGSRAFFNDNPNAPRGARRGEDFSQTRDWPETAEPRTEQQEPVT
ncbi:nuclear transport factor 2 family protein (plasmid) [Croceicoccus marinus]|uniref:Nuclear transport factor 2 family protein n=3 Tax=Croceicoccus marinus TaxID=450378 RepID=A0A7G6W0V3_9SPHN|nr:nuclear transport factor 2 family protein [Croceicoccus marinus]